MDKPTVVSLFSGIGGIDIAFRQAGFEILWANEIDSFACTTYKLNLSSKVLIEGDINHINEKSVPQSDVLTAGFPCQSFSLMGHQRGFKDSRGNLFFEIIRIAKQSRPKIIFLENVRNLINHDKGKTLLTIFNSLSELDYYVKYDILSPHTHANIPQERNRTFIVAFSDYYMMCKFAFPEKVTLTNNLDNIFDRTKKQNKIFYYNSDSRYFDLLNKRIPDITGMYRIDDSGIAMRKYEISPTLKANMGTYHDRVPVIRDNFGIRKITPMECLALQGFPAEYTFGNEPIEQAYKQCGNTVCVPVVRRIASEIYKCLRGNWYEQNL